ncbi:MAG: hypothetical protein MK142_01505, partial [Pseudomonadales bacterium]|nr:hypothetical protein [Pseudomonadales bacterium]
TAVSGSAFSSLQASNLDLNGTINVIGGELTIDPLLFDTFDEQSQTSITLAEGVATFGDSSVLTGGGNGVQLFGGRHVFTPGAAASGTLIANARVLEIQDDAATTPVEGLTVEVFESGFGLDVTGDGNLTIVSAATLRSSMSGTGQTIIETGAQATVENFLRLEGNRTLVNNGTFNILGSLDPLQDTSVSNFGLINVDPGDNPFLQIGSTNGVGLLVNEASGTIVVRPAPFLDENAAPSSGGLVNVLTNFDNAGTVTLESGFLRLFGDGTHTGAFQLSGMLEGGTLDGARLRTFGSNVFEESASVTGVSFGVQGGTTTFDGTLAVESTFVFGDATFTLNTDTSTRLFAIFGSDEASLEAPEALPTFGGTGNVTVTERFSFEEGAIVGSGLIDVQAGATTTLGSTFFTTAAPQLSLSGRTIRNAAAFTSSEDPEATASVFSQGNLQIQNGGVFEQVGDLRVTGEGGLGTSITVDEVTGGQFILTGTLQLDEALAISGADLTGGGLSIGDGFLSLNDNLTVGAFEMTTGTLNLDGDLTILNTASLGGTLSGSGQTTIAETAVATIDNFLTLGGNRTLLNEGELNLLADLELEAGAVFRNVAQFNAGSENVSSVRVGFTDGQGTFINEATGTSTVNLAERLGSENEGAGNDSGPGEFDISANFDNAGSVTVQQGYLTLNGAGTHTGSFQIDGEFVGLLEDEPAGLYAEGDQLFTETATVTGLAFGVDGGTTTFNGTLDVDLGFVAAPGTFLLNSDTTARAFGVVGPELDEQDPEPGTVVLGGTGNLTVSEYFVFQDGTIEGSGRIDVLPSAYAAFGNVVAPTETKQLTLKGRTLSTAAASGVDLFAMDPEQGGRFVAADLVVSDGGRFEQLGTLRVGSVDGAGTSFLADAATEGSIAFAGNTDIAGAFSATGLEVSGGTTTIAGASASAAQTLVNFNQTGGVLEANAPLTISGTSTLLGTLAGSGLVSVNGTAALGGTQSGSGTTRIEATAAATLADTEFSSERTLENLGTLAVSGSAIGLNGATFDNQGALAFSAASTAVTGSGTLTNSAAGTLTAADLSLAADLTNEGTVTLSGTSLALDGAAFENQGALAFAATSTEVSGTNGGSFTNTGSGTVTAAALALAVDTVQGGASFSADALQLAAGNSLSLQAGATTVANVFNAAGTVTLAGGSLSVQELALTGELNGSGTVSGLVTNSGLVSPGFSPGALTIDGDYVQTEAGTLRIEIDGNASEAGTDFDLLAVNGNASFDGTLEITALEGFTGDL